MSDSGESTNDGVERQALSRLEDAVLQLIESRADIESRALEAQERIDGLEKQLRQSQEGDRDVTMLRDTLGELKAQNADLRARISKGREGVDRLLSRIRFLDDQA